MSVSATPVLPAMDPLTGLMRVLHVYSGNLYGGIETMLATIARSRGLCPALESHFGLCFDGRLANEITSVGAPLYRLGAVHVRRPWTVWRARRALAAALRRHFFHAVICHSPWPLAIFGPVVRAAGRPLVFWLHEYLSGRSWMEKWARRCPPDLAVCTSRSTAESLPVLYPNVPVAVVHCAVTLPAGAQTPDLRQQVRQQLGTPLEARVVVQVSRMEWWKGQTLLLRALGLLRDDPTWVCWQVGGAEREHEVQYLRTLKVLATNLGIADRVCFLGRRTDVARLLAGADIHCQPNLGPEPFGITFVEAMAAGLPIVTTVLGAAAEVVGPANGVLVPPDDAAALADALRSLISDPELCRRLGDAGPCRARLLCDPSLRMEEFRQLVASRFTRNIPSQV